MEKARYLFDSGLSSISALEFSPFSASPEEAETKLEADPVRR